MKRPNDACGFSMIEVLVTIVLISIGVLGMVALQGRTIAYTQDAVQRNNAAILADDLLEMMRADLDSVLTDGVPKSSSDYYKAAGASFPDAPDDCGSFATLTARERLGCWAEQARASLAGSSELMDDEFSIAPSGSAIEIRLAWAVKDGECPADAQETSVTAGVCPYRVRVEL